MPPRTTTYSNTRRARSALIGVPLDSANPAAASIWALPPFASPRTGSASRGHRPHGRRRGQRCRRHSRTEERRRGNAKYLKEITGDLHNQPELVVENARSRQSPLVIGGDHSVAAGTVSGVAKYFRRKNQKID